MVEVAKRSRSNVSSGRDSKIAAYNRDSGKCVFTDTVIISADIVKRGKILSELKTQALKAIGSDKPASKIVSADIPSKHTATNSHIVPHAKFGKVLVNPTFLT